MCSKKSNKIWHESQKTIDGLKKCTLFGQIFENIVCSVPDSRTEFGRKTGLSNPDISAYINEDRLPNFLKLRRIIRYLKSLNDSQFIQRGDIVVEDFLRETLIKSYEIREFIQLYEKIKKKGDVKRLRCLLLEDYPNEEEIEQMYYKIPEF